ncbi:MAG TPA: 5-oxoprolinase subunit PxpB [Puia sp.]|jgi:inhibitor of KinA|nr:5-oxoprolinase subunit PxpB [Puia sp.]
MNRNRQKLYFVAVNGALPSIYPLGDSALTLDLGNCIDEQLNTRAVAIYDWLGTHPLDGVIDRIVAYSSVSVLYDPTHADRRTAISAWLLEAWQQTSAASPCDDGREIRIPVCYEKEYAPDLEAVARQTGLSPEQVADIHCSVTYRIYMIGFLPGFPYLGKIDPRLGIPRKTRPVPVVAGGVGIAGLQTGIYPLNSPGGWQIIGRTPLQLFDRAADPPVVLHTGDRVRFYPVSTNEFLGWAPPI